MQTLKIQRDYYIALAKKLEVDYVYNTAALEGNNMTYPEVETLLSGITVGGHKISDELMILNQRKSWRYLVELLENREFIFNKQTILKLHSLVAFEEALEWGKFRTNEVSIGGTDYQPPRHDKLDGVFSTIQNEVQNEQDIIDRSIKAFALLSKKQLFFDGNKRTARLIANGILLDNGYPMLNIKAKDRLMLNQTMLNYYNNDNVTDVIEVLKTYYFEINSMFLVNED